jgi:hypothetical protein
MQDDRPPLRIFAPGAAAPPLRTMADALKAAGYPVTLSVGIAGEASEAQLDATDWEAAFVRWQEPELHDVYLITRYAVGTDEEADQAVEQAIRLAQNRPESADKLIVIDHLRRSQTMFEVQLLPALLADEDHAAWEALDVALRDLATRTEGLIYAEGEGFYDADGEPLLVEAEE